MAPRKGAAEDACDRVQGEGETYTVEGVVTSTIDTKVWGRGGNKSIGVTLGAVVCGEHALVT